MSLELYFSSLKRSVINYFNWHKFLFRCFILTSTHMISFAHRHKDWWRSAKLAASLQKLAFSRLLMVLADGNVSNAWFQTGFKSHIKDHLMTDRSYFIIEPAGQSMWFKEGSSNTRWADIMYLMTWFPVPLFISLSLTSFNL